MIFTTRLIAILLLVSCAAGASRRYTGTWSTDTNRKLDGTMTCLVTDPDAKGNWLATFAGKWQGSPFSYTVRFTGEPEDLKGKATVDGVEYDWTGEITDGSFVGDFTSGRYVGRFKLKPAKKK